jgi:pimeloyl-ACP methyl ester carboxylesterase
MRPLFLHYRGKRPVYALDLPGYGFSARPKANYTADIFVQAVLSAVAAIGAPVDVIGFSLGSEFVSEAAKRKPELFHSLVLLSPSGMGRSRSNNGSQSAAENGLDAWLLPLLSFPLWARPLYDLLSTRKSIEYYLQKSFVGTIPPEMIDYSYKTTHQPGAEHAPFAFISGKLFTANAVDRIYRHVTTPTLVIHDRDAFVGFDRLPELLAAQKTWQAKRISPTLGLAHWERTTETTDALDSFWKGLD